MTQENEMSRSCHRCEEVGWILRLSSLKFLTYL